MGLLATADPRKVAGILRRGGPYTPLAVRPSKKVAPQGADVDVHGPLQALGLPSDLFGAADDFGPTINDTLSYLNNRQDEIQKDIDRKKQELADSYDPFSFQKLQNRSQQAETDAELVALQANPPPKQQFAPFSPGTPYPRMESLPVPERQTPQVSPVAAILGAIGGVIAPRGAAAFGASTIRSAIDKANQTYQDALKTRKLQLQDLEQRHTDELNARNEAIRYAEENLRGKERVDFLNAIGDRNYELAKSKVGGAKAGEAITAEGLNALTGTERERAKAQATLDSLQTNKADLASKAQAITAGQLEQQKRQIQIMETIAKLQEAKAQHEANAAHQQEMENISREKTQGFYDPNTGVFVPGTGQTAQSRLQETIRNNNLKHQDAQARISASKENLQKRLDRGVNDPTVRVILSTLIRRGQVAQKKADLASKTLNNFASSAKDRKSAQEALDGAIADMDQISKESAQYAKDTVAAQASKGKSGTATTSSKGKPGKTLIYDPSTGTFK